MNKNGNTCVISTCTKKWMRTRPWRSTESLQWTQSGLTQTNHSRESPCRSDQECARESSKVHDRPDLYAGTPPLEALKATISIAANNRETFSIMHIDVSRAYFHAKAQRPVLIRLPVEDRTGTDAVKVGLMKKSMYGTRDAPSNWDVIGKITFRIGDFNWDAARKICSTTKKTEYRV